MTTKVLKMGNSLGVYIPKKIVDASGIAQGTPVSVSYVKNRIVIEPVMHVETLDDILSAITPENSHEIIDFGVDVGKEIL